MSAGVALELQNSVVRMHIGRPLVTLRAGDFRARRRDLWCVPGRHDEWRFYARRRRASVPPARQPCRFCHVVEGIPSARLSIQRYSAKMTATNVATPIAFAAAKSPGTT